MHAQPAAADGTCADATGGAGAGSVGGTIAAIGAALAEAIASSVVETETHAFLTYADFHAQDWEEICRVPVFMEKDGCHENDMEGATLVIRKDGSRYGTLELMATQAHGHLYLTSNDPRITSKGVAEISAAPIVMEGGSHPQLFSQAKGHGVCAAQDGRCGQKTGGRGASSCEVRRRGPLDVLASCALGSKALDRVSTASASPTSVRDRGCHSVPAAQDAEAWTVAVSRREPARRARHRTGQNYGWLREGWVPG